MTVIDRDHLAGVIAGYLMQDDTVPDHAPIVQWTRGLTDAILALVQPAAGITLTPEEAERAASWYYAAMSYAPASEIHPVDQRVVGKFEASA